MRSLFYTAILLSVFLLGGCGDESDEAACRFNIQQSLDNSDFKAVIAELSQENSSCKRAYSSDEWLIDLGAAYMGNSGLSISDIIGLIENGDTNATSTFATFIKGVSEKQASDALGDLAKASDAYTQSLGNLTCNSANLSTSSKDVCLFIGLVSTLRGATTINYLTDASALLDDGNETAQNAAKAELTASVCALSFANEGEQCPEGSVSSTDVLFTYSNDETRSFRDLEVNLNGAIYHRLATPSSATFGTTVITDGYCDNSFGNFEKSWSIPLLACPLNRDPLVEDQEVATLLVEVLNSGIDAIASALSGDAELQDSVLEYKAEIDAFGNKDGKISIDEIQDYLNDL